MYLVVVSCYKTTVISILNLRLRFLIHRLISLILLRRFDLLASFSSNIYYNNVIFRKYILILAFINAANFTVAKSAILSIKSIINL